MTGKRYDKYKESEIPWIGEVPEQWDLKRGKYITRLLSGYPFNSDLFSHDESDMPLIRIRDISNKYTESFYSGKYEQLFVVRGGDVLVGMDGDFNVAVWRGPDALLNQRVLRIYDTKHLKAKYLYYALPHLLKCINDVTYSTTVKHLSVNDIYNSYFPVPTSQEQDAIVTYLDRKCEQIDKAIKNQERRVELLKELSQNIITNAVTKGINPNAPMKESGVFWIGSTPQNWIIKRIKFTGSARNGLTYSPNDICSESEGILVLRSSNIQNSKLDFNDNVYVSKINNKLLVKPGDTVICSRNGSISLVGKCAFIEENIYATFGAFMMRYRSKEVPKFAYYMVSTAISKYKALFATTTVNQLILETFNDMYVSVPPIEEQKEILCFLEQQLTPLKNKISNAEQKIDLLRDFKQSLITEVVTGKRKVI